jgi:putative addiction module component (TIGR02574 family)
MPNVVLPLKSMSVSEKLQVIERVWASLKESEADLSSPKWHGDLLEERRALHAAGEAKFSDWVDVKKRIRRKVRES